MRRTAVLIAAAAFSFAYADGAAENAVSGADVGVYGTIIDRQMFGPLPDAFDPSKPPGQGVAETRGKDGVGLTKEQEDIQKNVHFSVINLTPEGESVVGFTDNANQKEPRHYYLKVGETRDGWLVKAADAATETMTLVKEGVEVTMKLGDKSGKAAVPMTLPAAASVDAVSPAAAGSNLLRGRRRGLTLRSRRMEVEKERLALQEAAEKKREEEHRKSLEEHRQEMILSLREELARQREEQAKQKSGKSGSNENENNNAQ